jgi:hypothetical protein
MNELAPGLWHWTRSHPEWQVTGHRNAASRLGSPRRAELPYELHALASVEVVVETGKGGVRAQGSAERRGWRR